MGKEKGFSLNAFFTEAKKVSKERSVKGAVLVLFDEQGIYRSMSGHVNLMGIAMFLEDTLNDLTEEDRKMFISTLTRELPK